MAFIYITGAPGVGKSTIERELKSRGLEVYDLDHPELGGAHNKSTGERVNIPPAEDRKPEWFDEHEWRINIDKIKRLKHKAENEDIFVCGVAPDDENILSIFDEIFYLKLDENALKNRVANRTDNDFGQNSDELRTILERNNKLNNRYSELNAYVVDASLTPEEIAGIIIKQMKD